VMPRPPRRPLEPIHRCGVRLEPVRSLPARLLAEAGAELGQAPVGGGDPERPSRLALLVRIVDVVVGRVNLNGPDQRIVPIAIGVAEPPQVHLPDVETGLTLDDPFRHCPANAPRPRAPAGAGAGRDVE